MNSKIPFEHINLSAKGEWESYSIQGVFFGPLSGRHG